MHQSVLRHSDWSWVRFWHGRSAAPGIAARGVAPQECCLQGTRVHAAPPSPSCGAQASVASVKFRSLWAEGPALMGWPRFDVSAPSSALAAPGASVQGDRFGLSCPLRI